MPTGFTSESEIRSWLESVQARLESQATNAPDGAGDALSQLSSDLEAIVESLLVRKSSANAGALDSLTDAMDSTFATWQASISKSYSESGLQEFRLQTERARRLADELNEHATRFERSHVELEKQIADNTRQSARLSRQRKQVAKELAARKSKMEWDLQCQRDEIRDQLRREMDEVRRAEDSRQREELEELQHRCRQFEQTQQQLEFELNAARQNLDERQDELDRQFNLMEAALGALESTRVGAQGSRDESKVALEALQNALQQAEDEADRLRQELHQERQAPSETAPDADLLLSLKQELTAARDELEKKAELVIELEASREKVRELQQACEESRNEREASRRERSKSDELAAEVERLTEELSALKLTHPPDSQTDVPPEIADLQRRLSASERELDDVKQQNSNWLPNWPAVRSRDKVASPMFNLIKRV